MKNNFYQIKGYAAILVGLLALGYAYYFVVAPNPLLYSLLLLLQGVLVLPVVVALYSKLNKVNAEYALVALLFGVAGALGMMLHGGYDLANVINPPQGFNPNLPNMVDPRGLLVFGATGYSLLTFSWLMSKDSFFAHRLSNLGYLSGALLVWIYLARLIVLDPTNPVLLAPVLAEGFLIGPLWYIWLGISLRKG